MSGRELSKGSSLTTAMLFCMQGLYSRNELIQNYQNLNITLAIGAKA